MVTLPSSSLGNVLQSGSTYALNELFMKNPDELVLSELKAFSEKLQNIPEGTFRKLPIGEAMLQLNSKTCVFQ